MYKGILYIALIISVFSQFLKAQNNNDSLYNEAVLDVYDDPDNAIKTAEKLFELNEANGKQQIKALLLASNAYSSKRDYEKSLEYALRSNEINKNLQDPKLQIEILSKIAAQYHQLGVNDKALEVLDEADKESTKIEATDSIRAVLANNNAIKGFIYRDQLSCDIAITYFDKANQTYFQLKETRRILANKSVVTYNKGNCLLTLNQINNAKENFKRAEAFAQKAGASSLQAFSLKGLAEAYTLEGKYEESLKTLQEANTLAENVGDLVLNNGVYRGMANNYLALKDWNNFQTYKEKGDKVAQQIINTERSTIHKLLESYTQNTLEKEKKVKRNFGGVILFALLLLGILFYFIIKGEISFQKKLKNIKSKIKV
ncbi:MAG: tetratricopeptide repeat protein [Moheibacter sp.]